ncbi:MAG: lytic transglycosylase domain-containing protein [Clostridiales bacterium]|nr:lytic transglycosylase domain-containing protein [Clostridiales bacterium]
MSKLFKLFLALIAAAVAVVAIHGGYQTGRQTTTPVAYSDLIYKYAAKNDLDPCLVMAVIKTESNFIPDAHSGYAGGLMQLTEETALEMSEDMGITYYDYMDPETNVMLGCHYLRYLIDFYGGNTDTALAAYNGGMGNVYTWLNDPAYSDDGKTLKEIPFTETRNYVERVNTAWEQYKGLYG